MLAGATRVAHAEKMMPESVLRELPDGWEPRASAKTYGLFTVQVPSPADVLAPKLRRNEPRDCIHAEWARVQGLL